ncbi:serine/threonine-protein kinase MPH1, partial [Tanacetum coccineum]
VTDKALLKEVLSGSMSNKDGTVKDDGCIYMVLEYGEIDLAHMLSQKWRELDDSRSTIDENWLRFYWQQILLSIKTIHEERVVHSDLKPANFLLVRSSLKLIDFGIAKAILSDTTNIQRDSQVGTLSYMSPEAFMCNETDANGNIIKCGRPSDIWSLGCILYQMVYGRTPFADYTTFWAKFKVITDPNHEIQYEPLSNLWLLDLIKKCLAWDRKERWTIPQLLQHPFLVPPIPPPLSNHNLIELVTDACSEDREATLICSRLQQLVEFRVRLVSKPWKSLIDSSEFIANYHVRQTQPQHRLLVSYTDNNNNNSEEKYVSIADDDTFPQHTFPLTVPVSVELLIEPTIVTSQGLLCLYCTYEYYDSESTKAVIWNPTIRKSVSIVVPNHIDSSYETVVGFGVCPNTCDPKLVKVAFNRSSAGSGTIVEVFSLGIRAWRRPAVNLPPKSIAFTENNIAIDSEEFMEIRLPDSLALDLENGVPNLFKKLFTIKTPDEVINVLGFTNSGEAIIEMRNDQEEAALFVYKANSENSTHIGITGKPYACSVSSYMETLLLLDH